MTKWVVVSDDGSESEPFDSRSKAEDRIDDLDGLVDAELRQKETDGGKVEVDSAEVVEMSGGDGGNENGQDDEGDENLMGVDVCVHCGNEINDGHCPDCEDEAEPEPAVEPQPVENDIPESPDVAEDPISWMPEHFVDVIEGVPAINRKGYAVLVEHYDISVKAKPITYPGESDWEYAEFRAIATTPDGDEYTGYGSAHVDRDDDKTVLGELAETRACKRAVAWATGVGMTAVSELQHSFGGDVDE